MRARKLFYYVGAEDHYPISNGVFSCCAINKKDVVVDDGGGLRRGVNERGNRRAFRV